MRNFEIGANDAGQRLDKYLKKLLPNASTGFLYKMLRKKNITLDGKKATGKELLKSSSTVTVFFREETLLKFMQNTDELKAEYERLKTLPMKGLHVIYEDDDTLAADKPENMLSQKAKPDDISANEYLLGYLIRSHSLSFEDFLTFRPSVCNRLDRNTTGLLLMGKSLKGSQDLSEGLRDRSIRKYYRAMVYGTVTEPAHLSGWLKKDVKTNKVQVLDHEETDAVKIETKYRPVSIEKNSTMLEIHLITGKTHQIRAHLASIGHPVIGDMKYGNAAVNKKYYEDFHVNHQLLHAYRLEFPDGRVITAPLPRVFQQLH